MKIGYEQNEVASEQPPDGIYRGVVAAIYDVGLQAPMNEKEPPAEKVCVAIELVSNAVTGQEWRDSKGQRHTTFKDFRKNLFRGDKKVAYLREFLDTIHPNMVESMLKDTGDVDTDAWIREGVLVSIKSNGKRAKADSFMPWPAGSVPPSPEKDYSQPFGLAKWLLDKALPAK